LKIHTIDNYKDDDDDDENDDTQPLNTEKKDEQNSQSLDPVDVSNEVLVPRLNKDVRVCIMARP